MVMKKIIIAMLFICMFFSYTFSAKLWFNSELKEVVSGCPSTVKIMLDTEGQMTTAMDLKVAIDNVSASMFFNWQWWLFKEYTFPTLSKVDSNMTIYTLLSTMSRWWINSSWQIWEITFVPIDGADFVSLSFVVSVWQDVWDSSIIVVEDGVAVDILSDVSELKIPIVSGVCDSSIESFVAMVEDVNTWWLVLIKNLEYESQYKVLEYRDLIMSYVVVYIDIILFVLFLFVLALLYWVFFMKRINKIIR